MAAVGKRMLWMEGKGRESACRKRDGKIGLGRLPGAACTSGHFVRFTCCGKLPHILPVDAMELNTISTMGVVC
eukprot:102928-Chlamydomonas_euryale.AAC.2